jgi:hypothetical protein
MRSLEALKKLVTTSLYSSLGADNNSNQAALAASEDAFIHK